MSRQTRPERTWYRPSKRPFLCQERTVHVETWKIRAAFLRCIKGKQAPVIGDLVKDLGYRLANDVFYFRHISHLFRHQVRLANWLMNLSYFRLDAALPEVVEFLIDQLPDPVCSEMK